MNIVLPFIHSIVLKIASRCNINCKYCYMYNMGDNSYLQQPKIISNKTIKELCFRIKEHCYKHKIKQFNVYLHGGEPLLVGKEKFISIVKQLRQVESETLKIFFGVQTNGILIDEEWCDIFIDLRVHVGISLDGNREDNDANRVDKRGRGTYDRIVKGIDVCNRKLSEHPFGVLSVLNPSTSAVKTYKHLEKLKISASDFLLLDTNHDHFKPSDTKKVGNWLISLCNYWMEEKQYFSIRLFEVILVNLLGGEIEGDVLGSTTNNVLVIETDGSIEAVDVLKICGDNFTKNNLSVFTNALDDAFENKLANIYYNSNKYLARKCLACPVQYICGGGYIAHRYSSVNGFNNPSVYCDALLRIITHIQNKMLDQLPDELKNDTHIERLSYAESLQIIYDTLPDIPTPDYTELLESFRQYNRA